MRSGKIRRSVPAPARKRRRVRNTTIYVHTWWTRIGPLVITASRSATPAPESSGACYQSRMSVSLPAVLKPGDTVIVITVKRRYEQKWFMDRSEIGHEVLGVGLTADTTTTDCHDSLMWLADPVTHTLTLT